MLQIRKSFILFLVRYIEQSFIHLYRCKSGIDGVVYLDDGLQIRFSELNANCNLENYLGICSAINLSVSDSKTMRAVQVIVFLGLLLDSVRKGEQYQKLT